MRWTDFGKLETKSCKIPVTSDMHMDHNNVNMTFSCMNSVDSADQMIKGIYMDNNVINCNRFVQY